MKLIGDGSVSGKTAWMDKPYLNSNSCGISVCSDEQLETAIDFCKQNKCQLSVHAMGTKCHKTRSGQSLCRKRLAQSRSTICKELNILLCLVKIALIKP